MLFTAAANDMLDQHSSPLHSLTRTLYYTLRSNRHRLVASCIKFHSRNFLSLLPAILPSHHPLLTAHRTILLPISFFISRSVGCGCIHPFPRSLLKHCLPIQSRTPGRDLACESLYALRPSLNPSTYLISSSLALDSAFPTSPLDSP